MPTYPVINKETGEEKELSMTMAEYEQWKKDNPLWQKDWSKGCASAGEVGDWQNSLKRTHPGWGEVMNKVKRANPRNKTITEKY